MSSPQTTPGAPPEPRRGPMWVSVEFVVDDGEKFTHYALEGHPGAHFEPEQFKVEPEWTGEAPMTHLEAVTLLMNLRLVDCTLNVTNEPTDRRKGLRLVD